MSAPRMDCRIAAIVVVDGVGYSRLMEADEAGTHARLKALLIEFIEPRIAEHHGRVVKLTGDGALCEFPSVVDATHCAILIQRGMTEREKDAPDAERIRFRIGINLGDVIHEEGNDVAGNRAVPLAARGVFATGTAWPDLAVAMLMQREGAPRDRPLLAHLPLAPRCLAVRPARYPQRILPSKWRQFSAIAERPKTRSKSQRLHPHRLVVHLPRRWLQALQPPHLLRSLRITQSKPQRTQRITNVVPIISHLTLLTLKHGAQVLWHREKGMRRLRGCYAFDRTSSPVAWNRRHRATVRPKQKGGRSRPRASLTELWRASLTTKARRAASENGRLGVVRK
jgi:hypothetical protein